MTADPFVVPITALRRQHGARHEEHRRGHIEEVAVTASRMAPGAEADADVVLEVADGGIVVSGVVDAPWVGECCRCLKPVRGTTKLEVQELYRTRAVGEDPEEDEETYPLGHETLDLRPLVRDAVVLGLPLTPLCRPDCAGLCPQCGADLNAGECSCPAPLGDPRWAALDVLKSDKE